MCETVFHFCKPFRLYLCYKSSSVSYQKINVFFSHEMYTIVVAGLEQSNMELLCLLNSFNHFYCMKSFFLLIEKKSLERRKRNQNDRFSSLALVTGGVNNFLVLIFWPKCPFSSYILKMPQETSVVKYIILMPLFFIRFYSNSLPTIFLEILINYLLNRLISKLTLEAK